jgi:CheY-like chemotaxis protein
MYSVLVESNIAANSREAARPLILLVEDDAAVRQVMRVALESARLHRSGIRRFRRGAASGDEASREFPTFAL